MAVRQAWISYFSESVDLTCKEAKESDDAECSVCHVGGRFELLRVEQTAGNGGRG